MATAECLWIRPIAHGNAVLLRVRVLPAKTERGYAVCVNGAYTLSVWCGESPEFSVMLPGGADVNAIYLEDIGQALQPEPSDIPAIEANARAEEAETANRLRIPWNTIGKFKLTAPLENGGASQLSAVTVTGARRNVNVQARATRPTRARLYYTLERVKVTTLPSYLVNDDGNYVLSDGNRVRVA